MRKDNHLFINLICLRLKDEHEFLKSIRWYIKKKNTYRHYRLTDNNKSLEKKCVMSTIGGYKCQHNKKQSVRSMVSTAVLEK